MMKIGGARKEGGDNMEGYKVGGLGVEAEYMKD